MSDHDQHHSPSIDRSSLLCELVSCLRSFNMNIICIVLLFISCLLPGLTFSVPVNLSKVTKAPHILREGNRFDYTFNTGPQPFLPPKTNFPNGLHCHFVRKRDGTYHTVCVWYYARIENRGWIANSTRTTIPSNPRLSCISLRTEWFCVPKVSLL